MLSTPSEQYVDNSAGMVSGLSSTQNKVMFKVMLNSSSLFRLHLIKNIPHVIYAVCQKTKEIVLSILSLLNLYLAIFMCNNWYV